MILRAGFQAYGRSALIVAVIIIVVVIFYIFYLHLKYQTMGTVQNIELQRRKCMLIKLAAHYYIYMHC